LELSEKHSAGDVLLLPVLHSGMGPLESLFCPQESKSDISFAPPPSERRIELIAHASNALLRPPESTIFSHFGCRNYREIVQMVRECATQYKKVNVMQYNKGEYRNR
jgi:hypothetical protein